MNRSDFSALMMVVVVLFLVFKSCGSEQEYKELTLKYEESSKTNDSLGRTIVVKNAEITENQQSMKDLRAKLFETTEKYNKKVKEVKALVAQKTEVVIKEKEIPYIDTPGMKKWKDSLFLKCGEVLQYYEDSAVIIGTKAKDSTEHYKLSATIGKNSLKVNEISFIDSQYLSVTEFKGGFFLRDDYGKLRFYKNRKTKIEIKHTNPYFENKSVDGFFYKPKSRNFDLHTLLGGTVIGASVALLLMALL